jgi:predicted phosphodiesterase
MHLAANEEPINAYKLVKMFATEHKPWDQIVFLGDCLDFDYIAKFNQTDLKILTANTFQADFDMWKRELDEWQECSNTIIHREGNHEFRINSVLAKAPALTGAIELDRKCGYKSRGIKFSRVTDLPIKIGRCYITHGWYTNIHHAKNHVLKMGDNIIYGHTHDVQSYSIKAMSDNSERCAWSMGCLCDKQPDWVKGKPTKYMHAFGVLYVAESGIFNLYTIRIIEDSFIFEQEIWDYNGIVRYKEIN